MLPLWRNRAYLWLSPTQWALGCKHPVGAAWHAVFNGEFTTRHTRDTIADALPALLQPLTTAHCLYIQLSAHWSLQGITPWQEGIESFNELTTLAEHQLAQAIGHSLQDWQTSVIEQGWQQPAVCCALPTQLIGQLAQQVQTHGHHLVMIEPVLNGLSKLARRHNLQQQHSLLIQHEPGMLMSLRLMNGNYQQWLTRRMPDQVDTLPAMLSQILAMQSVMPERILLSGAALASIQHLAGFRGELAHVALTPAQAAAPLSLAWCS
ncbi:hypothetical protein [Chitinivorax sp. B]|uniref:hypothetical protein n=1 Tax=Chitinivorax sp. B TaxID=2502235 RepID=UPI0010F66B7A|nr:hypothetical protein [Chitinivorax sp. B]